MGSAFALKNKAQQEEELSKETHTHKHKKQQRTHRNTETTAQERPMRDTTQGSIPRNFIQKRPSSIGRNTILLPRSLGRKQSLVVMEKSGKQRLTPLKLKKE